MKKHVNFEIPKKKGHKRKFFALTPNNFSF